MNNYDNRLYDIPGNNTLTVKTKLLVDINEFHAYFNRSILSHLPHIYMKLSKYRLTSLLKLNKLK
jgi:hypothetical protein